MATKSGGGVKAVKAEPQVTMSNGAATPTLSARIKPLPAKVIKNLAALGEPYRLVVLGYVAAATGPVMPAEIEWRLGTRDEAVTLALDWLKRHGWLTSGRVPKSNGGGWSYKLSEAGRERLMALGG